MKRYLFRSILSLGAVVVLASCGEKVCLDSEDGTPGGDSDKVCFVVSDNGALRNGSGGGSRCGGAFLYGDNGTDSIYLGLTVAERNDMSVSRAAYITEADYSALRMTCLKRTGSNSYSYYFSNVQFSKDATGTWVSNPPYWWLDANTHFKFYGYAPAAAKGVTYIKDEQTWEPKLEYEVPTEVKSQADLVYNVFTQEYIATANQTVPLSMKHALANVAFKTGTGMAAGMINKVTVKHVAGRGTLNLTNGEWTLDPESVTDFSVTVDKASSDGQEITTDADKTYFMLLPGCNSETTTVEIEFTKADGTIETFSGPLTDTWEAGKQYLYCVTIDPDFNIEFVPETQDAHYVICKATVSAANMQQGQQWELVAETSDGANVTLLSELNEYQKNGFWTDRILYQANGATSFVDQGSARGESTLTGSGSGDVYIFLPENVTDKDRDITLTMKVAGSDKVVVEKTFIQLHPDWTDGGFGWEQIENDPEVAWGFLWDRKVTYRKVNEGLNRLIYGKMVEDLVTQYNASEYTIVSNTGFGQRTKIEIDYTKLNDLSSLEKELDFQNGLQNTKSLYSFAGGAVTGNLEQAIKNLAPGLDFWLIVWYRRCGEFEVIQETGKNNSSSAALGYILRKNKYNWVRIEKIDEDKVDITEVPVINVEDIVWYLPAKEQFQSVPKQRPLIGDYWSSNPDGQGNAFTREGSAGRMEARKVRACRNPL